MADQIKFLKIAQCAHKCTTKNYPPKFLTDVNLCAVFEIYFNYDLCVAVNAVPDSALWVALQV